MPSQKVSFAAPIVFKPTFPDLEKFIPIDQNFKDEAKKLYP